MAITVLWDNDAKTAVRYDVESGWTWEDYDHARDQFHALLDTVEHKVDLIIDMRKGSSPPDGAMWRFKSETANQHPNVGATMVYIGARMIIRSLFGIFDRLYRGTYEQQIVFADTLEEARAVLAEQQAQLP